MVICNYNRGTRIEGVIRDHGLEANTFKSIVTVLHGF